MRLQLGMYSGETVRVAGSIGPPHPTPHPTSSVGCSSDHSQDQSRQRRPHVARRREQAIADQDLARIRRRPLPPAWCRRRRRRGSNGSRGQTVASRHCIPPCAVYPSLRDGDPDSPDPDLRIALRCHHEQHRPCRAGQEGRDRPRRFMSARRGPPAHRRRARRRQDQPRQGDGGVGALHVEARAVHARPAAGRPRRRQHLPAVERVVRLPARPAVRQHRARRRDQPSVTEDAVGAARGDGRAPGQCRRRKPHAARAVHGHRHAEPGRAGGHVPPAREPARPVPDATVARLSRTAMPSSRSCRPTAPTRR